MLGDVLVFPRGAGGHVAFYVGEDSRHFHILGGNQDNQVSIILKAKQPLIDGRELSKIVAENTAAMNKLADSTDETAEVTRTLANAVQLVDRTVERLGAERGR